ncbi:MAG TPA: ATP-binding protein [Candidatus Binatia bacterium]
MDPQPGQRRLLLTVIGILALALVSYTFASAAKWIHSPFPGFFLYENLTVGPYSLPGWTGGAAGIKPLDQIVAVDGRPLRHRTELYDLVKSRPIGTAFHYRAIRDGREVELTIPSMELSFHQWFLSFGLFVVVGVAFLIIGAAPYYSYASSPAALPLCGLAVTVFVWFGTIFDYVTAGSLPKEVRFFALTLTPSTAIHMALILKTGSGLRRAHANYLWLIYGAALLIGGLNSVTFFGSLDYWIYAFRVGYFYLCLGAVSFLIIIGLALRQTLPDLERSRLRVMLIGAILGFLLPTLCAVLTSSFQWSIPYNLALVPTVFFPFSVAYALLKYSLFDLGNTFKLALSRIALTAFLLAIYAVVALLIVPWAGFYDNDPLVPLFFSVVIVLVFNPLLRKIENMVNWYIYRQEYDPAQVQNNISLFLRSLSVASLLAKGFLSRVTAQMGIQTAAVAYRPQGSAGYLTATCNFEMEDLFGTAGMALALWGKSADHAYHAISKSEASTNPAFRETQSDLLQVFDQARAEILIPVIFEQEVRGFIFFGPKCSGREYSADDLRLLMTLTDQLALSLENGRLYEDSEKSRDEYQRLYREAELAKQRLVEADRLKKNFVANICHELRTPVSAIIGYCEVLLNRDVRADGRDVLERLMHNGQDLSQLMDNLLDFSRIEAGGVLMQLEMIKLKEILQGLELMGRRIIRERPIDFRVNIDSKIDTVETDPKKLQQILINLLTNAIKFTHRGAIEVTVKAEDEQGLLEIAVADTGIGIKAEDQEVIFEDFRQLDGSSTRQYGGTGVGLAVCRKLAESLGGKIRVASEFGVGSVFSLLLPLKTQSLTPRLGDFGLAS